MPVDEVLLQSALAHLTSHGVITVQEFDNCLDNAEHSAAVRTAAITSLNEMIQRFHWKASCLECTKLMKFFSWFRWRILKKKPSSLLWLIPQRSSSGSAKLTMLSQKDPIAKATLGELQPVGLHD